MKAVIAALCFLGLLAPLRAEELTVHWKEVPQSLVANRKVDVQLNGGTALRGKALAVMSEGLRMEIINVDEGGADFREASPSFSLAKSR